MVLDLEYECIARKKRTGAEKAMLTRSKTSHSERNRRRTFNFKQICICLALAVIGHSVQAASVTYTVNASEITPGKSYPDTKAIVGEYQIEHNISSIEEAGAQYYGVSLNEADLNYSHLDGFKLPCDVIIDGAVRLETGTTSITAFGDINQNIGNSNFAIELTNASLSLRADENLNLGSGDLLISTASELNLSGESISLTGDVKVDESNLQINTSSLYLNGNTSVLNGNLEIRPNSNFDKIFINGDIKVSMDVKSSFLKI